MLNHAPARSNARRSAVRRAPQRTLGVEADAVDAAVDRGPDPPAGEAEVVVDVEGRRFNVEAPSQQPIAAGQDVTAVALASQAWAFRA